MVVLIYSCTIIIYRLLKQILKSRNLKSVFLWTEICCAYLFYKAFASCKCSKISFAVLLSKSLDGEETEIWNSNVGMTIPINNDKQFNK